jgi:hypothetical protein
VRLWRAFAGEAMTRALVAPRLARFFRCRHRALDLVFGPARTGSGGH